MIFKKTIGKIKIGDILNGEKTRFRVEGCLVFEEKRLERKDEDDSAYTNTIYRWEEWELVGFNNYDSWLEIDHYTRKVSIYEPIYFMEPIDPVNFRKGDTITLTEKGSEEQKTVYVEEVGEGTIIEIQGKNTFQVFKDEKMAYATLKQDGKLITIEKYNNREYDAYKKREITRKEQKKLFGKVIYDTNWLVIYCIVGILIFYAIITILNTFLSILFPSSSSSDSNSSGGGVYTTRGIHGGGGGGVGK